MPRRIDIDHKYSRAIAKEIGEKLRAALKPEPDQPESLKTQIERLRKLEERAPSIVPGTEHGNKPRR
ncbi:hypothetical protein SAMN05216338_10571 [Bradyrhizobium sp. Rc2d]|uniref:hypothetical protein n=1 Tax=Bradyrhizobium sp. Rc2d TaxID=1855321 RepID=UPI00088CA102|nr:hypothetical protein [Bradyrhizobium sp. Rc2d]SDJ62499.1 hypothetical protein SAMN05216338_10571 [Bradyrhizobium sp. Rc2d]